MKHRLSEAEWRQAIRGLSVKAQTLQIAHGVLVKGMPQTAFVAALGLTPGAVSQAVHRIWRAHLSKNKDWPAGYEYVHNRLKPHQAYRVKRWLQENEQNAKGEA